MLEDYHKCSNIWNMKAQPLAEKWRGEIADGNRLVFVYKINGEFIGEIAIVFEMNDEGLSSVKVDEVPEESVDSVKEAMESCPTGAIEEA